MPEALAVHVPPAHTDGDVIVFFRRGRRATADVRLFSAAAPQEKIGGPLCIAKQNKRPLAVLRCRSGRGLTRPAVQPPPAPPARASPSRPQGAAANSKEKKP